MYKSQTRQLAVVLGLVTTVQALLSLCVLAAASIAPRIAQAYEIGVESIGYQIGVIYFAASVGSIGAGVIVRRHGPATTSMIALVLAAAGLATLAIGSLVLAVGASLLIGIGYALTNPSAGQILDRHCPPGSRNFVFSLKQTSVPIGGILAGLALPLIAETAGWRIALLAAAALCLAACSIVAPFRREWDADRDPSARFRGGVFAGLAEMRTNRGLRSLAITSYCFSAMQLSLMSYVVAMLVVDFNWTLVAAGGMAATVQFFGAGGRLIWGWLADRTARPMGVLSVIGAVTSIAALSMQVLSEDSNAALFGVILILFGFTSIGWNGIMLADITRHVTREKVGDATGGVMAITFAGVVTGPSIMALVNGVTDKFAVSFSWLALFPVIGAVTALRSQLREGRVSKPAR